MTQKEAKEFFEIVKQDDLTSFCAFVDMDAECLKTAFGRFPLLSVLYLFESKKVLKKFENKLLAICEFVPQNEPFEIYQKFRSSSKRSLRVYAGKDQLIMPIEMLAILRKDAEVKMAYRKGQNTRNSQEKLAKIYALNGQKIACRGNKIRISTKPKVVRRMKVATLISVPIAVLVACFLMIATFVGLGTNLFPKQIYSLDALVSASGGNNAMALNNDFVIDEQIAELSGVLDGKGHTITIKSGKGLFEKISGTLKNVNIVFECESVDINGSFGAVSNVNDGTIKNVDVTFSGEVTFACEDSCFCGYVVINNGEISNCSATFDVELSSSNAGEVSFSGIAKENNARIEDCKILGEEIISDNVDLAGVSVENGANAVISNCKNSAKLTQRSNLVEWSPNVGGIALTNDGTIKNCTNNGDLSVVDSVDESSDASAFVGGICVFNNSAIFHCKNDSDISVSSVAKHVYVGGICASVVATSEVNAGIEECGALGNILIDKSDDVYAICGGLIGYFQGAVGPNEQEQNVVKGYIVNCFETCDFSSAFDTDKNNFSGLMIGIAIGVRVQFFNISLYIDIQNDYCLSTENVSRALATVYVDGEYSFGTLNADYAIYGTVQQIEQTDVYW